MPSAPRKKMLTVLTAISIGLTTFCAPLAAFAQSDTDLGTASANGAANGRTELDVEISRTEEAANALGGSNTSESSSTATNAATNSAVANAQAQADNAMVDDVKIEGNRLVPTEHIMSVVKTKPGDKFNKEQVIEDLKAINGLGYFDDRSLQVVPELSNGGVLLKIRVQENAPVTQFSFQGNQVLSTEDISKAFADQLGKPQNLSQLSQAIERVEQAYHEKGFILAQVTDVKDDPDGSISLTINEGSIDNIEIAGNRKTKDFIVKNAIKIKPGTAYNERQLTADLRKLYANGYFQDIRRSLVPSKEPGKYTLKIEVDEKRTGAVGLGGGVDSVAGPFGSLSFSDSNFRGRGQVVSFNSQMGSGMFGSVNNAINNGGNSFLANQRTYQLEANFIEPNLKGTNTSMAVSAFGRNFNSMMVEQSQQRTLGASVNFSKPLKRNFNLNLGLAGENTSLKNLSNLFDGTSLLDQMTANALKNGDALNQAQAAQLAQQVRDKQLKGGTYATISPSITYDTRDSAVDPRKGSFAKLSASPSVGLTGSTFAKLGASYSTYKPINKSVTLAFNAQAGTALGSTPGFAQYRLGGWNGVRGYRAFSDLGTGTTMLLGTAEVRGTLPFLSKSDSKVARTIAKNVRPVLFADFGQTSGAGLTNSLLARSGLGASVGVGLRMNVPMLGMVRLDYGFPLVSSLLGGMTPRFTVGFGEKF